RAPEAPRRPRRAGAARAASARPPRRRCAQTASRSKRCRAPSRRPERRPARSSWRGPHARLAPGLAALQQGDVVAAKRDFRRTVRGTHLEQDRTDRTGGCASGVEQRRYTLRLDAALEQETFDALVRRFLAV